MFVFYVKFRGVSPDNGTTGMAAMAIHFPFLGKRMKMGLGDPPPLCKKKTPTAPSFPGQGLLSTFVTFPFSRTVRLA